MQPSLLIIVFVVAVLAIATVILFLISRQPTRSKLNREFYQVEWLKLSNAFRSDDSGTYELAVINADKLVAKALEELRIPGQNMGERLKVSTKRFSNLDALWAAHKLRNQVVHETNVQLTSNQVKQALVQFKQALKDLGAI